MATTGLTAIKGIDIVAYLTRDGERAKAYYRDRLGLPMSTDYGPQGAEFELADGSTFGVWQMDEAEFHPSGGVMFAVADAAAAVNEFKSRGVAFDNDGKVEDTPVCLMAVGRDPDGNSFIIHQRKS